MQRSFSELEYAAKKKVTRRDRFLSQIDAVTPWADLVSALAAHYPKSDQRGRPPIGLERMLRMYVVQQCFGLSDEGIEDAVYDSQAIRRLLETHQLTQTVFNTINLHLSQKGLLMREGTIVDATLIAAPSSTKNGSGERDPEMHQTKKGKQWHFGMKAHIGVDAESGLVHTVVATAANEHDVTQTHALLHGKETDVFADAGYVGVAKREENEGRAVNWHVAMRPGKRRALPETPLGQIQEAIEHTKARIRAKVEHPFHVVKNLFKHKKTRYRGLAKNAAQLLTLFGLANLMLAVFKLSESHPTR